MLPSAFGDWTRRQSAMDTRRQPLPVDPRISERKQNLESILRTTRWPTKNNVAEGLKVEDAALGIPNPLTLVSKPPVTSHEGEANPSDGNHNSVP